MKLLKLFHLRSKESLTIRSALLAALVLMALFLCVPNFAATDKLEEEKQLSMLQAMDIIDSNLGADYLQANLSESEFEEMLDHMMIVSGRKKKTDLNEAMTVLESITLKKALVRIIDSIELKNSPQDAVKTIVNYREKGIKLGLIKSNEILEQPLTVARAVDLFWQFYNIPKYENPYQDERSQWDNFYTESLLSVGKQGKLDGVFKSQDAIDWVRWRWIEPLTGRQIIANRSKFKELTHSIDLNQLKQDIDFSRLGIGAYQLIIEIKTEGTIEPLLNQIYTVQKNEDQECTDMEARAELNMKYLNISQGPGGTGGHRGTYAIDLSGIDTGRDAFYAPFDGIITKIYSYNHQQNFVWLQSQNKIRYADGTYDYVTVMTGHDNDISDLHVGDYIKKGSHYYSEGDSGRAWGNHIHLEVARGKTTDRGWCQNDQGIWHIENMISPETVFYIPETTTIINSKNLDWQREGVKE